MRSKIKFLIILVIILAIVGFIYINTQRIGNFILKRSLILLQQKVGVKLSYSTVSGNLFRNPSFVGISLRFSSGDSILADRLSINYNPVAILRGKFVLSRVEINSPALFWQVKKDTALKKTPEPEEIPIRQLPILAIERFTINNGKVFINSELRAQGIQAVAWLKSDKQKVRADLKKLSFATTKENITFREIKGNFLYSDNEISADSIWLKTDKSNAALGLNVNILKSEYEIQIRNLFLDVAEFINEKAKLSIQGKLVIDREGLVGRIAMRADDIVINKMALPDFRGELELSKNYAIYSIITTKPVAETIWSNGELDLNKLTYKGQVGFQNLRPSYYFKPLPEFRADGMLEFAGTNRELVELQLKSRLHELPVDSLYLDTRYAKGRIKIRQMRILKGSNTLDLVGALAKNELDLDYKFNGFPIAIVGKLLDIKVLGDITGKGKISGSLDSLAAWTEMSITHGGIEQFSFAKLNLSFDIPDIKPTSLQLNRKFHYAINNIKITVDTLTFGEKEIGNMTVKVKDTTFSLSLIKREKFSLFSKGGITLNKTNFSSQLDSFIVIAGKETLSAREPFIIEKLNDSIALSKYRIDFAGGEMKLNLNFKEILKPNIQLDAKNIDLSRIQKFIGAEDKINGIADISLKTGQNYDLNLQVKDFKVRNSDLNLKSIEGEITVSENQIILKKLNLTKNQESSVVTGTINYNLDRENRKFNFKDFSLQANIVDPGIWVFTFLKDILVVKAGKVYGSIEAKGDFQGTNLSGRVRVSDAKILVVATKSNLEKVNAELLFDKERIVLSKLSAQAGSGSVAAQGWTELHNFQTVRALQYDINCQDVPINPQKDIYGIVSGRLKISWQENAPTAFEGDVTVKQAILTIGFGQEVKSGPPSNLVYNITVKGERGIWLRNSNADIELSIDLNIRKTLTESFYSGILKTRQGNFYYLDHNLKVTEGEISFDNINELNPDLNLSAEMYTRAMKINSEKMERVKIILQLTGTLKQPEFNFYSEPAVLSQDDIISYLTLNVTPQEINAAEQREIFNKLVSERVLGYFEREVAKKVRDFIRLDYLMFETGLFEGGNGAKVTVGKYVAKNLYTTYTYNISELTQDIFKVEYYITKSHEMIGEKDEKGRYRLRYQFKFRF